MFTSAPFNSYQKIKVVDSHNITECIYILAKYIDDVSYGESIEIIATHQNIQSYILNELLSNRKHILGIKFFSSPTDWISKNKHNINCDKVNEIIKSQSLFFWNVYKIVSRHIDRIKIVEEITRKIIIALNEDIDENENLFLLNPKISPIINECKKLSLPKDDLSKLFNVKYDNKKSSNTRLIAVFISYYHTEEEINFWIKVSNRLDVSKVIIFISSPSLLGYISDICPEDYYVTLPSYSIYKKLRNLTLFLDALDESSKVDILRTYDTSSHNFEASNTLDGIKSIIKYSDKITLSSNELRDKSFAVYSHNCIESELKQIAYEIKKSIKMGVQPEEIVLASKKIDVYSQALSVYLNCEKIKLFPSSVFESSNVFKKLFSLILQISVNGLTSASAKKILLSPFFKDDIDDIDYILDIIDITTKESSVNHISKSQILNTIKLFIANGEDVNKIKKFIFIHEIITQIKDFKNKCNLLELGNKLLMIIFMLEKYFSKGAERHSNEIRITKKIISSWLMHNDYDLIVNKNAVINILRNELLKKMQIKGGRNEICLSDLSRGGIPPCKVLILCGMDEANLGYSKNCIFNSKNQEFTSNISSILDGITNTSEKCIITLNTMNFCNGNKFISYLEHILVCFLANYQKNTIKILDANKTPRRSIKFENTSSNTLFNSLKPCVNNNKDDSLSLNISEICYLKYENNFSAKEKINLKEGEASKKFSRLKNLLKRMSHQHISLGQSKDSNILSEGEIMSICAKKEVAFMRMDNIKNTLFIPPIQLDNISFTGEIICTSKKDKNKLCITVLDTIFIGIDQEKRILSKTECVELKLALILHAFKNADTSKLQICISKYAECFIVLPHENEDSKVTKKSISVVNIDKSLKLIKDRVQKKYIK